MTCKCFRCGKGFESQNPDDVAGDGRCEACADMAKKIAFKVDIEMSNKRRLEPPTESRIRKIFTEEQILNGTAAGSPRINFKDIA